MRLPAAALVLLLGCAERRATDGSRLDGPHDFTPGAPVRIALGDEPLSLTLMASAPSAALLSLGAVDLDGRVFIDPADNVGSAVRVIPGRGRTVALLASGLPTDLLVDAPGATRGTFWIKRGPPPDWQELPLALFTATAVDPRQLDRALNEAGRIWRAAGVELLEPLRFAPEMNIDRVVVDGALAGDSPDVGRALALSSRAPPGALALVVVGDLAGLPIWALAGGIPVPPVQGTPRSGVVVSAVLIERDPVWAGQVMAHEIGHALGLFHTTEAQLDEHGRPIADQLDDTAVCSTDANGDGLLEPTECDAANLMFWSASRGATALTPQQGAIARRSALTR